MIKYSVSILLLFYCMCASALYAQNADINLLRSINKNESGFKNKYLELNASSVRVISIGVPAGIAIAGFVKHDKLLQRDALYMGGAYLFSAIVVQSLKRIIDRQRPYEKYSFVIKRDDEGGGYSFPSGHTADAFCTATSVALRYHKWYFIAPSYLFATSVAWARVYQGVHYPTDVLGGAVVGTCSAWLGWKLQKWMNRKNKPVIMINQRW
jgi:membrane-associated phospholipid phosphatase